MNAAQTAPRRLSIVSSSPVETLLARLRNVRRYGDGWRADCPNGHRNARGSLSVSVADDSRILAHCFACNDTPGILAAVGLELADLYPERIRDPSPEARQRAREAFQRNGWRAALGVLGREAMVVLAAAGELGQGRALSAEDSARLTLAANRIDNAREIFA